jgi:hypothetical protein
MLEIKILGVRCVTGEDCPECEELRARTRAVLDEMGWPEVPVLNPADMDDFLSYGPTLTPSLAINGRVKSMGRVLRKSVIRRFIEEELAVLGNPDAAG